MLAEENSLKRNNYKAFLFINKYLPYVLSLLYMVNTLLSLFGIDLILFSMLGGLSLLPIIYQTFNYIHVSRDTFDNLVKEGKLPQGIRQQGFTEKAWLKKDLDEYLKNKNK